MRINPVFGSEAAAVFWHLVPSDPGALAFRIRVWRALSPAACMQALHVQWMRALLPMRSGCVCCVCSLFAVFSVLCVKIWLVLLQKQSKGQDGKVGLFSFKGRILNDDSVLLLFFRQSP